MNGILKHSEALRFIFGGNSTFTVLNTTTGNRFTYKVKIFQPNKKPFYFIKVLTNPEIYQFIGSYSNTFKYSSKSKISEDAQSIKVFKYIINHLQEQTLNSCIEIYHEGRCGKCGRPLTVPQSITTGIGPECLKNILSKSDVRQIKIEKILES